MDYYFANNDQQKGPFPREALRGEGLKRESLVWREGMASWQRADTVAELSDLFAGSAEDVARAPAPVGAAATPQYAQQYAPAPAPYGNSAGTTPRYGSTAAGAYPDPGQQFAPGAYGAYPPGPVLPTGLAIASMILGIVSIPMNCAYGFGLPVAIVGIVLGHVARRRIRRGEAGGDGMAKAGLICGYISVALAVVYIAIIVVIIVVGVAGSKHP